MAICHSCPTQKPGMRRCARSFGGSDGENAPGPLSAKDRFDPGIQVETRSTNQPSSSHDTYHHPPHYTPVGFDWGYSNQRLRRRPRAEWRHGPPPRHITGAVSHGQNLAIPPQRYLLNAGSGGISPNDCRRGPPRRPRNNRVRRAWVPSYCGLRNLGRLPPAIPPPPRFRPKRQSGSRWGCDPDSPSPRKTP